MDFLRAKVDRAAQLLEDIDSKASEVTEKVRERAGLLQPPTRLSEPREVRLSSAVAELLEGPADASASTDSFAAGQSAAAVCAEAAVAAVGQHDTEPPNCSTTSADAAQVGHLRGGAECEQPSAAAGAPAVAAGMAEAELTPSGSEVSTRTGADASGADATNEATNEATDEATDEATNDDHGDHEAAKRRALRKSRVLEWETLSQELRVLAIHGQKLQEQLGAAAVKVVKARQGEQ